MNRQGQPGLLSNIIGPGQHCLGQMELGRAISTQSLHHPIDKNTVLRLSDSSTLPLAAARAPISISMPGFVSCMLHAWAYLLLLNSTESHLHPRTLLYR